MKKIITIIILPLVLSLCSCATAAVKKNSAVADGFVIDGLDGKISIEKNKIFFNTYELITDGKGFIKPESKIEILTTSTLAKLYSSEKNSDANSAVSYRIWGKFTKYQNKNYIYLTYYMPVAAVDYTAEQIVPDDANEEKIIPDDVLALLRPKRTVNLAELKKPLAQGSDGVIAERTGFLRQDGKKFFFDFDGLGRNIDTLSIELLKNDVLQIIDEINDASIRPVRFKIAAIATGFDNKNYLLLQRATRAYNYGNFAK